MLAARKAMVAALLPALLGTAAAAADFVPAIYYPLEVGNFWVYTDGVATANGAQWTPALSEWRHS